MEDVARTIPEPQWAKLSDLKPGDTVELHGFDCAQGTVTIKENIWNELYFDCAEGKHFVTCQLDQDGYLFGITIRPAQDTMLGSLAADDYNEHMKSLSNPVSIPLTSERITMNLDANDANAVSSFFQSLADKVVLASTLPQKVEELSAVVDKLKADVENYREHMARADEEISNLRRERAALQDENAALRNQVIHEAERGNVAESRWNQACSERDRWHNDFISVSTDLEAAKRERDDAGMKVMELEEKASRDSYHYNQLQAERDELYSRLNSIRSALA